jgi:hypothetical protein
MKEEHMASRSQPVLAQSGQGEDESSGGWRGIESAPRDGTRLDLWAEGFGRKPDMCWAPVYTAGLNFKPIEGWTDHGDYYRGRASILYSESQFTHWMALPPAPSRDQQ